jgi:acetyl esterase/lipase
MDMIHANAEAWHIDTDRIGIMGFSAGGHLAGHYANRYDCPEVRAIFPDSKAVKVSILCYPVITADANHCHLGTIQNVTGHKIITDEDVENFSLERLVTSKTPPAFLWHTAEDDVVPVSNSILYAQALAKLNIPFDLHIYTHGRHGLSTVDDITCDDLDCKAQLSAQWLPTLKQWLEAML